jgi:hypothetical protein
VYVCHSHQLVLRFSFDPVPVLMSGAAVASWTPLHTAALDLNHQLRHLAMVFIIIGALTFITSVLFWFFFPDSPTNARFLTPEERVKVVLRVQENQAGVENKTFKGEQ